VCKQQQFHPGGSGRHQRKVHAASGGR
jgi:hypothetical protein